MTETPPPAPLDADAWPVEGRFEGRPDFQARVSAILRATAVTPGLRSLVWVSPNFDGWPLEDGANLAALSAWTGQGSGRLTWLAQDFSRLPRHCPLLLRWRRLNDHVVSCRQPDEGVVEVLPTLLLVRGWGVLRVFDAQRWTGRWTRDARDVHRTGEEVDAFLQRSAETFPVTTLGI